MRSNGVRVVLWTAALVALLWVLYGAELEPNRGPVAIPYSRFKQLLADGEVTKVTLRGQRADIVLTQPVTAAGGTRSSDRATTVLPSMGDPALLPALEQAGVEIENRPVEEGKGSLFLYSLLPWLIFLGIYWLIWRRIQSNFPGGIGSSKGAGDFITGSTREVRHDVPRVTFDDVAGQDNAKREVAELVSFLTDRERYERIGAETPRGILLMGPPGTGKTLLAKALAGEAKVPFFDISASEFIELYVGVGASRVRNMFDEARRRAPCIVFIDEIDSIGRTRGTGLGGGHDEREQTLNQILAEMDGFEGHEAVIVLAATNRPDVLDPALLRPGRFDRHVTLELPDKKAREAILKVHTRRLPLAPDVDLAMVAAGTPGFSGADIKNLCNEAAIMAAREGAERVTMRHLDEMRDKVMMGSVRTLAIQPDERHRLAVHESGHTAVAYFLPNADPLYKVSIIPRGRALGVTQTLPEEERHTLSEGYLRDRLAVMMGGRTAERVLLDSVSSGADDDIKQATALARAMVGRWGMSEEIGPMDVRESEAHPFLGREIAQPRQFSEATANQLDQAVRRLLVEAGQRAEAVIVRHRARVERLIERLEARETLGRAEIESCLGTAGREQRDC